MSGPVVIANLRKNAREKLRICLDNWQGHDLIDVRVTTQINAETDIWSPTKKGVSINVALLSELVRALQGAETKARELGLIGGES